MLVLLLRLTRVEGWLYFLFTFVTNVYGLLVLFYRHGFRLLLGSCTKLWSLSYRLLILRWLLLLIFLNLDFFLFAWLLHIIFRIFVFCSCFLNLINFIFINFFILCSLPFSPIYWILKHGVWRIDVDNLLGWGVLGLLSAQLISWSTWWQDWENILGLHGLIVLLFAHETQSTLLTRCLIIFLLVLIRWLL